MTGRLPTALEVAALRRAVEAGGGNATVLHKGDAESGTLLLISGHRGSGWTIWERFPDAKGHRRWTARREIALMDDSALSAWSERRIHNDNDVWIVELDIVNPERFIGLIDHAG